MASTMIKIAKEVAAALRSAKLLDDATLTKHTPGTRDPDELIAGTAPTSSNYDCKGFVESYEVGRVDGSIIRQGDKRITLIGRTIESLVAPVANDTITIGGSTYTVISVERDPAAATYVCQSRGA